MAIYSTSKLNIILCLSSTLLLLSSLHAEAESQNLKYCQKNVDYAVKVSSVEILPDPVVRGEPFTFKIQAYTDDLIRKGNLIYEISYAGIEGQPAVFYHDLSEETSLPVRPGHFLLTHTELLPPVTPPGTYNVKLTFDNKDGGVFTCITFPFTIGAKSSVSAI
ncbi:uncharacterized protein LOC131617716 [Vicia villosa]|uniref:uncharacterized protein LOC131617716 n=1 Tax=Vicia villosa TaxID=3911 RepID=UPI00273B4E80|nr:uncharacterized protein LOC131617716 [Vicia villosa]